jgi:peptide/nickel transport system ATP-binding protein
MSALRLVTGRRRAGAVHAEAPTPAAVAVAERQPAGEAAGPAAMGVETSAAGGELAVSVRELAVTFSRRGQAVRALRGVSLDVRPGEIVGIVGESGSGKTVLGLSMLGLLPRQPAPEVEGSLVVGGVDMLHAPEEERRENRKRLGAVFQDPMTSLDPTMRVGRQITEKAGTAEEAVRLLDAVGVPEARRRLRAYPHELSGGLRQRVMIAMAIAQSPRLVVADEPTTALDVTVQAQILELVRSLRDELRCAFVFITHDLGVAAQVADRIAVVYGGRLAELGPSATVLDQPAHPYTAGLLASRLDLESRRSRPLPTLAGEPPDPTDHPPGCAFAPRCPVAIDACRADQPALVPVEAERAGQLLPPRQDDWADVATPRSLDADGPVHLSACLRPGEAASALTGDAAWPEAIAPPGAIALECYKVTKSFSLGGAGVGLGPRGRRQKERLHALRGVDLRVAPGECVALVGESGSGKSTLLRVVAGLVGPDDGDVALPLAGRPQMVFQDAGASLTPWMPVGELVGERLRGEPLNAAERRDRVAATLELVGLPAAVASVRPGQLSGGQRQRVAIARAVVVPPSVLLCDEPTSALDVSLAAVVLNVLGRLRRTLGMATVFVTHDLAVARLVADRVAVMYLGRIVEDLAAETLSADARHPYTRSLLAAVPGPDRVHVPLGGEPPSPINPPSGCSFHPRCPDATAACAARAPAMLRLSPIHHVDCLLADATQPTGAELARLGATAVAQPAGATPGAAEARPTGGADRGEHDVAAPDVIAMATDVIAETAPAGGLEAGGIAAPGNTDAHEGAA